MIRASGYFSVIFNDKPISIKWNQCALIQKNDGYSYCLQLYHYLSMSGGKNIAVPI